MRQFITHPDVPRNTALSFPSFPPAKLFITWNIFTTIINRCLLLFLPVLSFYNKYRNTGQRYKPFTELQLCNLAFSSDQTVFNLALFCYFIHLRVDQPKLKSQWKMQVELPDKPFKTASSDIKSIPSFFPFSL